jgi:trk system potassium uptake protein TrkA
MKIIILGCGRVGNALAKYFFDQGHQVSVIDSNQDALQGLVDSEFSGTLVKGYGEDQDKLRAAGATGADLFIAVTDSDNINIFSAEVAVKEFKVKRAIARVDDQVKAGLFIAYGIETVSPVELTISKIQQMV